MYSFDVHAAHAFDVCLSRSHFNLIIIWFFSFSAIRIICTMQNAQIILQAHPPTHSHTTAH